MMYENENTHELNILTNQIMVVDTFCEVILMYCQTVNGSPFNMDIMHNIVLPLDPSS